MSPVAAILADPGSQGVEQAKRFGWDGPFPDKDDLIATFESAEHLTDQLMARHLSVLDIGQQSRLVDLAEQAKEAIMGSAAH
jgi:hypothetical protein